MTEHIGVIKIARTIAEVEGYSDLAILNIDNTDIQGKLRDDGLFDRMHQMLLLPESYKIRAIICDGPRLWKVLVESNSIPLVEPNDTFPEVTPTYQRNGDGSVSLSNIEITISQCGITLDEMLKMEGYYKQAQKEGTK